MNSRHISLAPQLRANIVLPTSKSISARLLIMNAVHDELFPLAKLSDCDDTRVLNEALQNNPEVIDVGAAGTAMRFLTAYYAAREGETHILTGTKRMKQRPIKILVEALRSLGAEITYLENESYPPLRIEGRQLTGGAVTVPGNVSSQYISALMMVAPLMREDLELNIVGRVSSLPYIEMTQQLMGIFETNKSNREAAANQSLTVEADWSAASYWYAFVALHPDSEAEIRLDGLQKTSVQGDSWGAAHFETLGVETIYTAEGVILRKKPCATKSLLNIDFERIPDLAQTFVVVAALLGYSFRFTGLHSLKIKETDRILALQMEMEKLGFTILHPEEGVLTYDANRQLRQIASDSPIYIDTYDDHRMAMAFAPAAAMYTNLHIRFPEVVSKSYPNFWDEVQKIEKQ